MIKVKTASGFECEIDPNVADDMEILDDIAAVDERPQVMPKLLEKILGEEQKKAMYDHLRAEDGRVPVKPTMDMFVEIMNLAGEATKN